MMVDLDDLERDARKRPAWCTNCGEIRAATNTVTLALVARIRELETQALRTIEATGLNVEDELETLRKLLEKGAVIA